MNLLWKCLLVLAWTACAVAADTTNSDIPKVQYRDVGSQKVRQSYRGIEAAVVVPADSVAFYQELVDRYSEVGSRQRQNGGVWLGVGIGSAVVGGVMAIMGVVQAVSHCDSEYDEYGNERCTNSDPNDMILMFGGYTFLLAGTAGIVTGITLKITGGIKLRRARRYQEKLDYWREEPQGISALELKIMPLVLPQEKAMGAALALGF